MDVVLSDGGVLEGQIIDSQGQPIGNTAVSLIRDGRIVSTGISSVNGIYRIEGLTTGPYVLTAGKSQRLVRLWRKDVAPPSSRPRAILMHHDGVVRSQGGSGFGLVEAGLIGASVAGLATAVVANAQLSDIEDDFARVRREELFGQGSGDGSGSGTRSSGGSGSGGSVNDVIKEVRSP